MKTIKIPHNLSVEDLELIREFRREQSSMIRTSYNMSKNGFHEKEIRHKLNDRNYILDSWFKNSAVIQGKGMYLADKELKRDTRIFGGKNNFIRRCKNLITKDEWRNCRLLPLYIIGEFPKKGNRKFNFENDFIIFKPYRGKKISIKLPFLKRKIRKEWNQIVKLANNCQLTITISIGDKYLNITYDLTEKKNYPSVIKNRIAGIDLNPNFIGLSIFDEEKLIETKLFNLSALTGKNINDNKLDHETKEIAHAIGRYLKHMRVDKLFIEELRFKQGDKEQGKRFNRLTQNQWKRATLRYILSKYFKLYTINAAYTSTIGNILNPTLPDPIAASCEIAQRGYRIVVTKNKMFYPSLPSTGTLKDQWKKTDLPEFKDWKELHNWLKNSKMRYRVPLPSEESFRVFQNKSSLVYVI